MRLKWRLTQPQLNKTKYTFPYICFKGRYRGFYFQKGAYKTMKYFILGFISTLTMLIATDRVLLKNYKEQEG